MEPIVLVLLGAGIAHLSSVIMEYRRHRLDRRYGRTDRRQAFQVEQLLALQAALAPLMECAWRQGRLAGGSAPAVASVMPLEHVVRLHRVLVLVEDDEIRTLTRAVFTTVQLAPLPAADPMTEVDWCTAHGQLQNLNTLIGEQVRDTMRGKE